MPSSTIRPKGETGLAWITLILSIPYLIGETYHYIAYVGFGNYFLGYFCDLITIALMWLGSVTSLRMRDRSASGWLAGAWGFAACLAYRAFTWRYEAVQQGESTGAEPSFTVWIIAGMGVISFMAFAYALYLARPRSD